jgi:hypothetical protein
MHRDHRDILLPRLSLSRRLEGDLVGVVVDQTSVREVKAVLLQIGLPLGLVPNEHELIVATFRIE